MTKPRREWVREYDRNGEWLENLNGIHYADAKRPFRWHRCRPQTRGFLSREIVERCACGGYAFDGIGPWIKRNSRMSARKARAWRETFDQLIEDIKANRADVDRRQQP